MSMHYRGVTYDDHSTAIETTASNVMGQYRGARWKLRAAQCHTPKQSHARLKYRGQWVDD